MNKQDLLILSVAEKIGFVLVKCVFPNGTRSYTYKAPLVEGVQEGDTVIVESPADGFVCVKVLDVQSSDHIDLSVPFDYKWIVQKVSRVQYDATNKAEYEMRQVLSRAIARKERDEMVALYKTELGESILKEVAAIANVEL